MAKSLNVWGNHGNSNNTVSVDTPSKDVSARVTHLSPSLLNHMAARLRILERKMKTLENANSGGDNKEKTEIPASANDQFKGGNKEETRIEIPAAANDEFEGGNKDQNEMSDATDDKFEGSNKETIIEIPAATYVRRWQKGRKRDPAMNDEFEGACKDQHEMSGAENDKFEGGNKETRIEIPASANDKFQGGNTMSAEIPAATKDKFVGGNKGSMTLHERLWRKAEEEAEQFDWGWDEEPETFHFNPDAPAFRPYANESTSMAAEALANEIEQKEEEAMANCVRPSSASDPYTHFRHPDDFFNIDFKDYEYYQALELAEDELEESEEEEVEEEEESEEETGADIFNAFNSHMEERLRLKGKDAAYDMLNKFVTKEFATNTAYYEAVQMLRKRWYPMQN